MSVVGPGMHTHTHTPYERLIHAPRVMPIMAMQVGKGLKHANYKMDAMPKSGPNTRRPYLVSRQSIYAASNTFTERSLNI